MSVIGRLDGQVEAVLINPLKRRARNDGDEGEREAPPAQPPLASRQAERDAESPEERREVSAALPVWLL